MLDTLFNLFKQEVSLSNIESLVSDLESIIALFNEEYLKDKNTRNAAIDCVIQILEKHKT